MPKPGCRPSASSLRSRSLVGGRLLPARSSPVLALYVGPYFVVNFWLVLYTWLQHTDVEVPHFADDEWSWVQGAFMSIDRPYGPLLDFLHHRIGSTHVAHHMEARIPHYHARRATDALRQAFPDHYRYDPTPVYKALWRVVTKCNVVSKADVGWTFVAKEGGVGSRRRISAGR